MASTSSPRSCPACGWFVPPQGVPGAVCGRCGFPQDHPAAAELRDLAHALAAADAERHRLLARRAQLLAAPRPAAAPAARPVPAPEATPRGVQNLLLWLGGALLTVAAVAFTVISWGHLGIGGRAAVLAALTLTAGAVPVPLLRRGLAATAEAVALLGLVLLVLDAYAVRRVLLPGPAPLSYAAWAATLIAAVWAGYAALMRPRGERRGLLLPPHAALVLAHLPLPLRAFAEHSGYGQAAAFLAVAVLDGAAVVARRMPGPLRPTALAAGVTTGAAGLLAAGALAARADGPGAALRAGALLLAAAACALAIAYRVPVVAEGEGETRPGAPPLGAVAALAATAAAGGVLRVLTAPQWTVPCVAACAALLLAGAAARWRAAGRHEALAGAAAGAALPVALAAAWALVPLAVAMFGPLAWAGHVWAGAPAAARAATVPGGPGEGAGAGPAVLTVAGVALLAVLAARFRPSWAPAAYGCAAGLGAFAVAGLPTALDLPYGVALALRTALAVALLAPAAVRRERGPLTPLLPAGAIGVAVTAACWALAERTATCAVLAVLTAAFAAAAVPRSGARWRAVAGCAAVGWAAALAAAAPLAAGLTAHDAAFAELVVAAGAQAAAWRLRAAPVEAAGCLPALLAVVLAADAPVLLSGVLAAAGVLAGLVALRADRRPAAAVACAVLLVAAAWVRLGAWHVTVAEAYTLPVTLAALTAGLLARRRTAAVSSWTAYGPGLAVTLLPSLTAAWTGTGGSRPVLLAAAALTVTLLGARRRLQAPLLLGGTVLVLDALHELAPYVVRLVGVLPRWLPFALAGALLLAVGATYERRLRDARRLREAVRRLS